jgi:fluoride exporter
VPDTAASGIGSGPPPEPLAWPFGPNPRTVGLVAVGGATGTLARYLLTELVPGGPVVTLAINVLGAFALAVLLERVARSRRHARGAALRLLLGTGLLGGFTTYSALSVETVDLAGAGPAPALLYAAGTLVLGLLAAALGIRAGRR